MTAEYNATNPIADATYSPEDNKLRLYPHRRLDAETYQRVKTAGFKWAPKQELFVAPAWSPEREDLCIELAGEVEAETTTLAERAQTKAERYENLMKKRTRDSNAFYAAARRHSERFASGQPILVGHHSERSARKDQARADAAMSASVKAYETAKHWAYKAFATEANANYKNRDDVRQRRVKTLLAELRDLQRKNNRDHKALELWHKAATVAEDKRGEYVEYLAGHHEHQPYWGAWSDLDGGKITAAALIEKSITAFENRLAHEGRKRWIEHTLNRLAYETDMLGETARYDGALTATILQHFTRTHGADTPKATPENECWRVSSPVPLPLHVADFGGVTGENEILLPENEWLDLMQQSGYEVEANQPKKTTRTTAPLLNINTESHQAKSWSGKATTYPVIEMTKAEHARYNDDSKRTYVSECGQYRFRTVFVYGQGGSFNGASWKAIFLTDSKAHPKPSAQTSEVA